MGSLRPKYHFAPQVGWINDPNGLIRIDGVYHLFYQANRQTLVHGPMHWGHATSKDLAKWTEQDIALFPDDAGQCFSGSAVAAAEGNVAPSLGADDGVLLFYTAHRNLEDGSYVEDQAIAVADRGLTRFQKFDGNPVLPTPGPRDFRDPKVIWHAQTARWIMVVTHGQSIGFYSSSDALEWVFESEFGRGEGRHGPGPWECPDLFPMSIQGSDETVWILIVGIGNGHVSGGSGTQYFVGDFDGHVFRNRHDAATELFMDWGRDYYAAQTFSGMSGEAPLAIAWMSNWRYANHTPTNGFRGCMSLPRRLSLVQTEDGLRLAQQVDTDAAELFDVLEPRGGAVTSPSKVFRVTDVFEGPVGSRWSVELFDEPIAVLTVERVASNRYVITNRRSAHEDISAEYDFRTEFSVEVAHAGAFDIQLFVDNGLVEIGCAGGLHWFSNIFFPTEDIAHQMIISR